jgi:DnaJ homolog subfamily A member 2
VLEVGAELPVDEEETKEVDNKKLYELLEVDPKASEQQIRSSYKKLVLKHHPDRGGDPDKIKEINVAYEVNSRLKIRF